MYTFVLAPSPSSLPFPSRLKPPLISPGHPLRNVILVSQVVKSCWEIRRSFCFLGLVKYSGQDYQLDEVHYSLLDEKKAADLLLR
ncbi:hypothetical protein ALC53_04221 [Atta colombica]|uniref:Uncharacterized protein n=1 Tax=Atta colombica TaxID=520822 RepID=A0A151I5E8_9HYME|nr:hypothetical protein ALC53_04221 [Atta colombica]